ncbi:hypothetical protein E2320_008069 [Naja naja]|nr:hypothetical protein E2320_008069 [Naja naja]
MMEQASRLLMAQGAQLSTDQDKPDKEAKSLSAENKPPSAPSLPSKLAVPAGESFSVPMGTVRKGLKEAHEQGLLDSTDLAKLTLCPLEYTQNAAGVQVPHIVPLPLKVLKDLKEAISLYGLQAPYMRGLIRNVASSFFMMPQDWKDLLRMIMTGPQYVVWESEYKREAEIAVQVAGPPITADHIFGSGPFTTLTAQMAIPPATFDSQNTLKDQKDDSTYQLTPQDHVSLKGLFTMNSEDEDYVTTDQNPSSISLVQNPKVHFEVRSMKPSHRSPSFALSPGQNLRRKI